MLNYLPKSLQAKANAGVREIWMAASQVQAERAFEKFVLTYQAKYPNAAACLQKDRAALLAFYDFPAEHWKHIRTANPIKSSFGTIRHRTDQTNVMVRCRGRVCWGWSTNSRCVRSNRFADSMASSCSPEVIVGVKFKDGVRQIAKELEQAAA